MKVYHGNDESRTLIGECQTREEAFDIVEKHVEWTPHHYRFWNINGELVIDYGSYRNFYYIDFEELENET